MRADSLTQLSLDFSTQLDYVLVVSPRAKRLTLRVEAGRGLVVTMPRRFPKGKVPEFVENNRRWIESALADIEQQTPALYRQWPPRQLALNAISQTVYLEYANAPSNAVAIDEPGLDGMQKQCVKILADPGCRKSVACEIAAQLRNTASNVLPGKLAAHADKFGLSYKRVQIRGQRTLWGSCSSSGTLSLNYKLLFLKPELLDYVLLHELAHTRYLDHSSRFWRLLETMQPAARSLDAQLARAGTSVPPWLELAR